MRPSQIFVLTLLPCLVSLAVGSYDSMGWSAPQVHGQSAGSYYHYHVPVVDHQNHHHQPSHHHDHSHFLWPLLLLLAIPLLFLPLLPLLLLPIGISLLALLAPGGMMMMTMMMMGGGMMMRTDTNLTGRSFQQHVAPLFENLSNFAAKYVRSMDLSECPPKIACHLGSLMFPEGNSTTAKSAKQAFNFLSTKFLRGSAVATYENAFWKGSTNLSSCEEFKCEPQTEEPFRQPWISQGTYNNTKPLPSTGNMLHINTPKKLNKLVNYWTPNPNKP